MCRLRTPFLCAFRGLDILFGSDVDLISDRFLRCRVNDLICFERKARRQNGISIT
jgi:hypothetical protein